ncbi:MAG: CBS domain-containing protein [archaeon]|nr:CBS domain-containing protein [archaeon]MCR4323591.1 CBS domain-containing protein [Nanoarchaeota archaeon]
MESGVKVGDIMTRNFVHVTPETDLLSCARTMIKKRVGSLIIKEGDKLKGILTEKDIIWAIVKKSKSDLKGIFAKDLMKRKVVTIKPSADLAEAMRRLRKKKVRRLPVVENGLVIGMLTYKDILRIDPGLYDLISQNFSIREEAKKLKRRFMAISRGHGTCEECGEHGVLFKTDMQSLCESCYNNR